MENLRNNLSRILEDYYSNGYGPEYLNDVLYGKYFSIEDDKVTFFSTGVYSGPYNIIDICKEIYSSYLDHHHDFDYKLNNMLEEYQDMENYGEIYFSDEICIQVWIQKHNAKYPEFVINENVQECYETHCSFDTRDYTNYVDDSNIIFADDEDDYHYTEFENYNNAFNDNYDYLKEILENNDIEIDEVFTTHYYSNREIVAWNIKSNSIEIYHHAGNEMCRSCTTLIFENGVKGV